MLKSFEQVFEQKYWGTSGAGILPICPNTGRILLSLRSKEVLQPLTWNVWSGKIDGDENPTQAAIRELFEETGYKTSIDKLIASFIYKDENFVFYNFLTIVENEFIPVLNYESKDFVWISLDDLNLLKPKHFGLEKLLEEDYKKIKQLLTIEIKTVLLDIDNTLCYSFNSIKNYSTTGLLSFKSKEYTTVLRPYLKEFLNYLFNNYETVGIFTARVRYMLEEFLTGLKSLKIINQHQYNMLLDNSFDYTYFIETPRYCYKDVIQVSKIMNKPVNSVRLFCDLHDKRDWQKQYKIVCEYFGGETDDTHLLDVVKNKIL